MSDVPRVPVRKPHQGATKLSKAPMAIASDGTILVNATRLTCEDGIEEAIKAALATGRPVFIGVELDPKTAGRALERLDDAVAEIAGRIGV
jgi:thiamine pyrophosphate-dependent acetolactate synthase large subunit-like protein